MALIVILAGGGGERLWPKSRNNFPKQCITLNGKHSLIQKTYEMAVQIVGKENVLVSTRKELVSIIQKQLPHVHMVVEPLGRDSAAGMGYVCAQLLNENIDKPTIFMGADYSIPEVTQFKKVLESAVQWAEKGKISTIGIKPTRIETRFGYINPGKLLSQDSIHAFEVMNFTEKPDEALAREYIAHGYLWNSGMFVVKPSVLYRNIRQYMPMLYEALEKIRTDNFDETKAYNAFLSLPKVSIDYGVMEKTSDLVVIRGDFVWDDIGTWDSLDRILESDSRGNIVQGEFLGIDVQENIIFCEKPIVAFGVSNIVFIETQDCTFVCHKNMARNIKQVIKELERHPQFKKFLNF
ncbi:MAG: mannose-1-phosphate guanylyltransferase [Candidatus Hodarchaeota archaeon]